MHTSITIQPGHVPRTTGFTGTVREQEFTAALGVELASRLRVLGWDVHVVPADPPGRQYPDTDLFLALHCDGSANPDVGSASFFFPPRDEVEATAWGIFWAAHHQVVAGYDHGFRDPNYVDEVSRFFYAWRADRVALGIATPADVCLLVEHYFATNPDEAEWAWTPGRIGLMAQAHVDALGAWNGHPIISNGGASTMELQVPVDDLDQAKIDQTPSRLYQGDSYFPTISVKYWSELPGVNVIASHNLPAVWAGLIAPGDGHEHAPPGASTRDVEVIVKAALNSTGLVSR